MIKEFVDLLDKMKAIHEKKNQDYAAIGKDFENFERCAEISNWFAAPIDKVYITLITVKLARLATLLNHENHTPNNESIEDSFLDLTTYCGLWTAHRMRLRDEFKPTEILICNKCGYQFLGEYAPGELIAHECIK
jgi:rubrerythrin